MTIVFLVLKYGFEVFEKPPGPTFGLALVLQCLEVLDSCEIATRN